MYFISFKNNSIEIYFIPYENISTVTISYTGKIKKIITSQKGTVVFIMNIMMR